MVHNSIPTVPDGGKGFNLPTSLPATALPLLYNELIQNFSSIGEEYLKKEKKITGRMPRIT